MLVKGFGALLLAGATLNFGVLFSSIPATQADLRQTNVFGDWRVELGPALFDQGAYLFQLGYGMINADVSFPGVAATDTPDDLLADRSGSAVDYLSQSVALDPGNAFAWTALAWAHAQTGDMKAGREAMAISWKVSPHNYQLSKSRAEFYAMIGGMTGAGMVFTDADFQAELTQTEGDSENVLALATGSDLAMEGEDLATMEAIGLGPLTQTEADAVRRDLEVMNLHGPNHLTQLIELMPVLQPLAPPPAPS